MDDSGMKTDLAVLIERVTHLVEKVDAVVEQTTKTNGRVTGLEAWKNRAIGAWFAVSVAGPIITAILVDKLS